MDWLLFVHSLPGQNGALRISVWRSLQAIGAGSLRDGVSILPERPQFADAFAGLRRNIVASGGTAHVLRVPSGVEASDAELRALFDRTKDYAELIGGVERTLSALGNSSESDARRNLRQHSRELARIEAMDFFGSAGRDRAQALVTSLTDSIAKTFSPDEPVAISAAIPQLRLDDFRRRVWATRSRMWVDRVASAWLVRRFVDPDATFRWLEDVGDAPPDAVGFDYDGATFTHVDDLTTFEVIAASFGLGENAALGRIGGIVHALDIGGPAVPEAAGFEAVLAGTRDRSRDDRELLSKMGEVLDAFYDAFANDVSSPNR